MRMEEWPAPSMDTAMARAREIQRDYYGGNPAALPTGERTAWMRNMILGLIVEATEALQEVKNWKWWIPTSDYEQDSRAKYLEELVDVAHFTAALAIAVGCTDEEWREMYHAKYLVNQERNRHARRDA